MTYVQKPNSGTLFQNDKGDNDKRPDYRGELNVDGVLFEIAGWKKHGSKGTFLSLSVKPKQERQERAPERGTRTPASVRHDDMDSEIPF